MASRCASHASRKDIWGDSRAQQTHSKPSLRTASPADGPRYSETLCNKKIPLKDRAKLFEATVTPSVMYGSSTWALTAERERKLTSTRRRMLRWMTQTPRRQDENWVDYIKRATHTSEKLFSDFGCKRWGAIHRAQKWKLAGKPAQAFDMRCTGRLLDWAPWFRCSPHRNVGGQYKRWDVDITAYAGAGWTKMARDAVAWHALSGEFIGSVS